ncbi:HhH-GPD base excision DNA repair family protein [Hibiscus syriacus]|uniref:HhH-GPD base excision DNA repair family protein n=1 Tax=Hibiscus syriacus TaxID=106335 RepID=A0A6A2ZW22_HIBSY|nr:uncharacterized protein LOC120139076 isoform X2 [Hibiscus syriacus]KAE8695322.1 HhH-GPD base excision DNA repair family protein [Hibiscus syriacus]
MAILGARPIGFSSFPSSTSYLSSSSRLASSSLPSTLSMVVVGKSIISRGCVACSAVQESSTSTGSFSILICACESPSELDVLLFCYIATTGTNATTPPAEAKPSAAAGGGGDKEEAKAAKPKPAAKAPAKALPELMMEDVIPSLKTILETQDDISEIELTFQDNKLEGSFVKEGCPYSFWAFFPDGVLTGPKGFSLSSYGSVASTVEPFLVDEKKITARHVVFWVEKRLAAQGIIPVWKE